MDECIERKAAIEAFDDPAVERYYGDVCPESVIRVIEQIPAADVRPVVRGHWIDGTCSNCGFFTDVVMSRFFSYCPNCGADMRDPPEEESHESIS